MSRSFWLALITLLFTPFIAPAVAQEEEEEREEAPAAVEADDAETEGEEAEGEEEDEPEINAGMMSQFRWRSIGPAITSGRVGDIAVNPTNDSHWIIAVCSGGVWETKNRGTTWKPIFDSEGSYSIGCVTFDPSNPNTIWVGTGENNSQRSVSFGDGVYKSTDGGKSFKNVGLKESEHIGMIAVDPRDSDRVFVAAQGPLWRGGGDRGLYRTTDGGETWECILEVDEDTGANEVHFDPRNPDTLYCSTYQRRRRVWTLINGGPGSGVWKSTDGGDTWNKIERGLPGGMKGRIGLDVSPVDPEVIYAIVEGKGGRGSGGVYRTTNAGVTWEKRSSYMTSSPQYYNEIVCDPHDVDRLYYLDTILQVSEDGGKTNRAMPRSRRHVDDHALWIDPTNPDHLVVGSDGGLYETYDRATWRFAENLPVTQFYRVAVDNSTPFFYVYGGTQDNATLGGPSRTIWSEGIQDADWFVTVGGDGFEPAIDPDNPNIVYSQWQYGGLIRYDRQTGERLDIKPTEGPGEAYKWNWDSPLIISPHNPARLYYGAQYLFRSDDRGSSWTRISEDMTRQMNRNELEVMGRVQPPDAPSKNASTSMWGNLVALCESPLEEGLLYAGSDDGLVHVTEDGGATWRTITCEEIGVPELTYVSCLTASQHDADVVFASFNNKKSGDFAAHLYRSDDRGRTWTSISGDLPERNIVYSVQQDHVDPDILFVGTEFAVYVTLSGGEEWFKFSSGIPTIAIRDIDIQRRDDALAVATFGRGFYVLDDYSELRHLDDSIFEHDAIVLPVPDTLAFIQSNRTTRSQGASRYGANNPPIEASFLWYLKDKPTTIAEQRSERERERKKADEPYEYPTIEQFRAEENERAPRVLLLIRDEAGTLVRTLDGGRSKGLKRSSWDLRWSNWEGGGAGPRAIPGTYTVEVVLDEDGNRTSLAAPVAFNVVGLGNASIPDPDRAATHAFHREVARLQRAVRGASRELSTLEERVEFARGTLDRLPSIDDAMRLRVNELDERLRTARIEMSGDTLLSRKQEPAPPSISSWINRVVNAQWGTMSAPTGTHRQTFAHASNAFTAWLEMMRELTTDVDALEAELIEAGAPHMPGRLPDWP